MNKMISASLALALISPLASAKPFSLAQRSSITVNSCQYEPTANPLDIALLNNGFFVLKKGKSHSLLFSRYGEFGVDSNFNVVDMHGDYLQGIDMNSPSHELKNIKLEDSPMKPQASSKVHLTINFDARDPVNEINFVSVKIYDEVGALHTLSLKMKKISVDTREIMVLIDDQVTQTGHLVFDSRGELKNQLNLAEIQWQAPQAMLPLTIDFEHSTQYASAFSRAPSEIDGNAMGKAMSIDIGSDGEIIYYYTNGKSRLAKIKIAVAEFPHPESLDNIFDKFYVPTKKSGPSFILPESGNGAFISRYIQNDFCLPLELS